MLQNFYFVMVGIILTGIPVFGQSQDRPNVLFIAIDDLNDWVGALKGHPQVKTPNIDRLAKRGVLFANAHTQAPLCNPSRVSIMTGLRPETTGIYNLAPHHWDVAITRDVVTLPQYFEANGYHTLSNGKIFHSIGSTPEKKVEFQEWGPIGGGTAGHPPAKLVGDTHMGNHPLLDWGVYPETGDSVRNDYKVATWAEEKLAGLKEDLRQPFFMAVGFWMPWKRMDWMTILLSYRGRIMPAG